MIAPDPVTVLMILPVQVPLPLASQVNTVTAPLPPEIFVNVLFVTFVTGVPPSLFCHPATVVAPVTVTLEKLLPLEVSVTVEPDVLFEMKN